MLRILFSRLGKPHVGPPQRRSPSTSPSVRGAGAITIEKGGGKKVEKREFAVAGGMCPRCEGMGSVTDFDLTAALRRQQVARTRVRSRSPATAWTAGTGASSAAAATSTRTSRSASTRRRSSHDLLHREPTKIKVEGINLTYSGLIPQIQKSFLSKDVDAMQPHIRAFVERAVTFTHLPRLRRHPAQRGAPGRRRSTASASPTPARCRSATWPTWVARPGRAVGRAAAGDAAALPRLVRGDRPRLPQPRPAVGDAVGRRGPAHQADPPPRLVADRRHVRVRRADDRAAPPRHRSG